MDPNATLKQARAAVARVFAAADESYPNSPDFVLAGAFDALDQWLMKGGFLPDAWKRPTTRKRGRKPPTVVCPLCGRTVRLRLSDGTMEHHAQKGASQLHGVFPCDGGGRLPIAGAEAVVGL